MQAPEDAWQMPSSGIRYTIKVKSKTYGSGLYLCPQYTFSRKIQMPYWKLFYHVVTATKHRLPLLTVQVEPVIYSLMENKVRGLNGSLLAINGIEDHVHLVVSIPPKISVADFVGQVKGAASTIFNKTYPNIEPFFWQNEYGIFTFDEKRINNVVNYVNLQKIHHANNSLIAPLERIGDKGHHILESQADYFTDLTDLQNA